MKGWKMKLNKSSEKAMAVIALLAIYKDDKILNSNEIAMKLNLSDSYTKKILRKLVVANIINAVSGNRGGYGFKLPLEEINVLMIIEAIEGPVATFPEHGVLSNVFKNEPELAKSGDNYIKEAIAKADQKWCEQLQKVTVAKILTDTFEDIKE